MDRKVLYIDGRSGARVQQDGPSLLVRRRTEAARRLPLRLLSRIVVTGCVEWTTPALLACADAAIPVSFVARDGSVRASLRHPAPPTRPSRLRGLMEDYFARVPAAAERYRLWVEARATEARAAVSVDGDDGCESRLLIDRLLERGAAYARAKQIRSLDARLVGYLHAHLDHLFIRDGVTAELPAFRRHAINPSHDYARIIVWRLRLDALRFLKREYLRARRRGDARAALPSSAAARFYEEQSRNVEKRFAALVRRQRDYATHTLHDDAR